MDASSTTTNSNEAYVCARIDRTEASIHALALRAGMQTANRGVALTTRSRRAQRRELVEDPWVALSRSALIGHAPSTCRIEDGERPDALRANQRTRIRGQADERRHRVHAGRCSRRRRPRCEAGLRDRGARAACLQSGAQSRRRPSTRARRRRCAVRLRHRAAAQATRARHRSGLKGQTSWQTSAAEEPCAHTRAKCGGDRTLGLDREVADASSRIQLERTRQGVGGTSHKTRRAGPAVIRRALVRRRLDFDIEQHFAQQEPRSAPRANEACVLPDEPESSAHPPRRAPRSESDHTPHAPSSLQSASVQRLASIFSRGNTTSW